MRGSIDYNVIVEIPEDAHVCSDQRIYIVNEKRYYQQLGYNMDDRVWIGKAVSDHTMHPNDNYKERYRDSLQSVTHLNLPEYTLRVGLYCGCLSIARELELYQDLHTYFGPESANLIMDFAMYSIAEKSNIAKDYQGAMADRMLFLGRAYSDSWIQERFSNVITDNQIQAFKIQWLRRCKASGIEEVWICIDGSNNDCNAQIDEAEKGKAKSHKNINIIGFMYAVDQHGKPILSSIYRGGRVDCKELSEMIDLLKQCEIKIKGVVLDRGFCDIKSIKFVEDAGYDYVIMMKETTHGFQEMMKLHRDELKMTWRTALGSGLYGTVDTVQLFGKNKKKACVALIWDSKNGVERSNYLVDEIMSYMESAAGIIASGEKPSIPAKYTKYLDVIPSGTSWELVVQEEELQSAIFGKGYYALICSKSLTAKEINEIYDLRDASEKQYSILKTQLGYTVFRSHQMHGIRVRENISFVASIIRNDMLRRCREQTPKMDLNKGLRELDQITMRLGADNQYHAMQNCSARQNRMLESLKLEQANLDYVADYENRRRKKEAVSPVQVLIVETSEQNSDASTTKRIDGIPEGSKAKGSSAKLRAAQEPKRRGRPPKKPTLTGQEPMREKRGPGRPKGSKNRPKEEKMSIPKRGRGRPKGSKNKPK